MSTQTDNNPELITVFERFYRDYYHEAILELANEYPSRRSIDIDWMDLYQFDHEMANDVVEQPEQMLSYADEALRKYDIPVDISFKNASARFVNVRNEVDITDLGKKQYNNRLLTVGGQVTQLSKIRQQAREVAFECQRCGNITRIPQSGDQIQEPHECQGCERQGPFQVNHDQSEKTNHQLVRIQKPPEGGSGAGKKIDVSLTADQVTSISDRESGGYFEVGDKLSMSLMQRLGENIDGTRLFESNYDSHAYQVEDTTFEDLDISEYIDSIREIASGDRGDPFELLVQSINPRHYGDEMIKLAIALQLFGGWRKEYPDESDERGDIHILLLGDPGSGKSTFLHVANSIVPRSVYASGKGATAAGMTASAVQDDFGSGSEWTLKAGAMVQADQGLACVDEIDKMNEDAVSSMHEALESQKVKVNKAGINATLNARASLLAAGNPKYGRFDEHEPLGSQIDLEPALMSRFDLMFMVNDQPDPEKDAKVVDHILKSSKAAGDYTLQGEVTDEQENKVEPAIDIDVLQAYIAYAQQNVHPQIRDDSVGDSIKKFIVGLREAASGGEHNSVPVTFRSVEGIRRLAEASARVRLSDTISQEDVERATSLVQTSMRQVGYDPEEDGFDVDIIETGMSTTQRDRVKSVRSIVNSLEGETPRGAPYDEVIEKATEELDTTEKKVEHEIEKAKDKGDIYVSGSEGNHLRMS